MRVQLIALAVAAASFLAACTSSGAANESRNVVSVNATVLIGEDGTGGYSFTYKGPFFDERGNFDFSKEGAAFNTVRLTFTIADGSVPGIRFKADATDAMWIVEKKNVDQATGSPRGPYRGEQFLDFNVSADGRTLSLTDINNDGILYRYGLRFDLDGKTVIDDPDGQNGGNG